MIDSSRNALGAAAALLVVVVAGCGGGGSGAVKSTAAAKYGSDSVSCSKAGIMVFVGKRADVYECEISGVDAAHRPAAHIADASLDRCFVRTAGQTYEVTDQIVALQKIADRGFNCR